jgi:hypothetical protein
MAKSRKKPTVKKIWNPDRFEVEIGAGTYIIEPQPITAVMQFDEVARQLYDDFGKLSTQYFVEEDGQRIEGPFESEEEALASRNGTGSEIEVVAESISMTEILQTVVNTPYPALRVLIPGLKEEDVLGASLPNLKFVLNCIIEANGVEWFERFLKNSVGPLLPRLIEKIVEGISEEGST